MPAHKHPLTGYLIGYLRDGQEIARRVARDGERAAQLAALVIAELGTLEIGDSMLIEETGEDLIVEILRTPHGSTL